MHRTIFPRPTLAVDRAKPAMEPIRQKPGIFSGLVFLPDNFKPDYNYIHSKPASKAPSDPCVTPNPFVTRLVAPNVTWVCCYAFDCIVLLSDRGCYWNNYRDVSGIVVTNIIAT